MPILAAYPHATDEEAMQSSRDLFRDSVFAWPTWAWASLQSQKGKGKAYVYYFDHKTARTPHGAQHASEIGYVFHNLGRTGARAATRRHRGFGPDEHLLDKLRQDRQSQRSGPARHGRHSPRPRSG